MFGLYGIQARTLQEITNKRSKGLELWLHRRMLEFPGLVYDLIGADSAPKLR